MTHVAEERNFGAVDLCQCFCPPAFFLIDAGVGNCGGYLRSHKFNEILVELVKLQPTAYAHNHQTGRLMGLVGGDWHDNGSIRWVRPGTRRYDVKMLREMIHYLYRLCLPGRDERPRTLIRFSRVH